MKRVCKNVNVSDLEFIKSAIRKCLKNKRKNRRDIKELFDQYGSIENLAEVLQKEILNHCLVLKPIWYRTKVDISSGKLREIGIQDIKQQIYDYIAVEGLQELLKRIGKFQCAAIKGRGQIYGLRTVQKWMKDKKNKYAAKLDIRHYYPSINRRKLMCFLRKRVKNENLLWLIETLIYTFKQGLSIGSYLSQHLANLYMSILYHYVEENCYKVRRAKRIRLAKRVLFYMDDGLMLGSSASDLHKAFKLVKEKAAELGLTIKKDWRIFRLGEKEFVDMMGFRIYKDHATIRKRVFLRLRRAFLGMRRNPLRWYKKVIAYNGFVKYTSSSKIERKFKVARAMKQARRLSSNESKILGCAA